MLLLASNLTACSLFKNELEYTLIANSYYEVSGIGTCKDTEIDIPAEYRGLPVKSIGDSAFKDCRSLTSITIPNSITSIGDFAFSNCSNLTYHTYDNAKYLGNEQNPYVALIDTTDSSIKSCEIHPQTKVIAGSAFFYCSSLKRITIPNSVTSIGDKAFSWCSSLTSVTIPNSVTSIGDGAFRLCDNLTSVTIPDSVTSIGFYAFEDCSKLTSITIPDGVTSIGYEAFSGCSSLTYNTYDNAKYLGNEQNPYVALISATNTSITSCEIHPQTKAIAFYAFSDCSSLTYNTYDNAKYLGNEENPYFALISATNTSITSCEIHPQTKVIADSAFVNCSSLKKITFTGTQAEWEAISK